MEIDQSIEYQCQFAGQGSLFLHSWFVRINIVSIQIKYEELQNLLADEEVRQAEQHKINAIGFKRENSTSLSSHNSDGFMSSNDMRHGKDYQLCSYEA